MGRKSRGKKERRASTSSPNSVHVAPPAAAVASAAFDPDSGQLILTTKDFLLNQLRRDSPKIAASFDALCEADLAEMSAELARVSGLCLMGMRRAASTEDELRMTCAFLLLNSLNSIAAAVDVLRSGYRLQPSMILRNAVESVAVVLHLGQRPTDLSRLKAGKLSAPATVASAKKSLPFIGQLYGLLTNHFSHVGGLHQSLTPVSLFTERDEPLIYNLTSIRAALWCISIGAELLFFDLVHNPRFWRQISAMQFSFAPSEAELEWARSHVAILGGEDVAG